MCSKREKKKEVYVGKKGRAKVRKENREYTGDRKRKIDRGLRKAKTEKDSQKPQIEKAYVE